MKPIEIYFEKGYCIFAGGELYSFTKTIKKNLSFSAP